MKQNRDTQIGERAKPIVRARRIEEAFQKSLIPTKKVTMPPPFKQPRSTIKEKVTPPSPDKPMRSKRPMIKEPTTGGSDTVPATSERNEFRKEMMRRNATPSMKKGGEMKKYAAGGVTKEMPSSKAMGSMGMAKGGKAKMKPAAKGKAKGNPFAATKFGAAMMKKSADTEGRAMKKFAKGGSIDGCAVKGKTKAKRVTMKKGGSC